MKRFLIAFVLFAFPFLSFAQAMPQLQVSKLQTQKYSYQQGETIQGSFVINNIGDQDANDIYYQVSYGLLGDGGGSLSHEFETVKSDAPLFIGKQAKREVAFKILPTQFPAGQQGISVLVMHKNGSMLGWQKIPVSVEGSASQVATIAGILMVDGTEYPLTSGPTISEDTDFSLGVALSDKTFTGMKRARIILHDRTLGGEIVNQQDVSLSFTDGIAYATLPQADLKPESYEGTLVLFDGSQPVSNTISFRYIIEGVQAEILNVQTDMLKVKKGQEFVVTISYAGTPARINDNTGIISTPVENLGLRVHVTNEKGEVVASVDQKVQSQAGSGVNPSDMTDDEIEAYVDNQLDTSFNIPFTLVGQSGAKQLNIHAELYDLETGEIYDAYDSAFPDSGFNARVLGYLGGAILLIILMSVFVLTRHKLPTVCLALIFGSLLTAHVIIQRADARIVSLVGGNGNGALTVASPISSLVGGYEPGASISLDLSYVVYACANNGNIKLRLFYPKTSDWHSFTSASQASSHIKSNLPSSKKTWKLECTDPQNWQTCKLTYITVSSSYYEEARKDTNTWKDSGTYWGNVNLGISQALVAPSTPGYHYLPLASQYCTGSHGCASMQYSVYEICVYGAGVCPDENRADICPNISGTQTSLPEGYVKDSSGSCVPSADVCSPNQTPSNYGQACGCDNAGTIQCNSSCRAPNGTEIPASCSEFAVSCSANPGTVKPGVNTTLNATIQGAIGSVSYKWFEGSGTSRPLGNGTSVQYNNSALGSKLIRVEAETATQSDSGTCYVNVSDEVCDNSHNGETECVDGMEYVWVCTSSGWSRVATGNSCGDAGVKTYKFEPNIVSSGGVCQLTLEAENVSSCSLYKTGTFYKDIQVTGTNSIMTRGNVSVEVGTYALQCTGVGEGATTKSFGAQQCYSNPDVRED